MRFGRFLACAVGVLATCMILAAPAAAATTQFDFDGGNLAATFGAGTLSYLNDTADYVSYGKASDFGAAAMADGDPNVMYFQAFNKPDPKYMPWLGAQAIIFDTASDPTPGYGRINQYTFIFDLLVPNMTTSMPKGYMALFDCEPDQQNPDTSLRGDAEFFVKRTSAGPPAVAGIGIASEYPGTIYENEWHRIAVTVDLLIPAGAGYPQPWGSEMHKYLDGVELPWPAGKQIYTDGTGGPEMRYSIGCGPDTPLSARGTNYWPFLFYDLDPETADGMLSSMYFTDRVMTASEIAALGGPSVEGIVVPGLGDANADGAVDDLDASILGANWQLGAGATWGMGDFNGDQMVNDKDAAILAAHWTGSNGTEGSVPEPGAVVLFLSAALALGLLRRR